MKNIDLLTERACKKWDDEEKKAIWRTKVLADIRRQPCYLCVAYDYCIANKGSKCDDVIRDYLDEEIIS